MPTVYETTWFRRHWSFKRTGVTSKGSSEQGYVEPNWENIDKIMNELTAQLNNEGWEIKTIIPLISSEYYHNALSNSNGNFGSVWGAAYGYGAGYTDGIVLICQRATEISEEESTNRKNAKIAAEAKRVAAEANKAAVANAGAAVRKEEIQTVSKGVFKANAYRYEGIEYVSLAEAEAKREAKAIAAENAIRA